MDALLIVALLELALVAALTWRCVASRRKAAAKSALVSLMTRR